VSSPDIYLVLDMVELINRSSVRPERSRQTFHINLPQSIGKPAGAIVRRPWPSTTQRNAPAPSLKGSSALILVSCRCLRSIQWNVKPF
jgi:hypothetical protein